MTDTQMTPAAKAAWGSYLEALEWIREFIFTREFADRPLVKEQGNQFLMQMQAAAYQWIIAPRVDYPRFYRSIYEPMVWNFGLPSPDYGYRWAFVDGSQTYKIWGKLGKYCFLDIQLQPLFGSVEEAEFMKLPTSFYPFDKMEIEADGSFEIVASPDYHPGNWIQTDPAQDRMALFVRECFNDWENERPSLLRIERVGVSPPRPIQWDEAEFIKNVGHAARFVKFIVKNWIGFAFDLSYKNQGRTFNSFATQVVPANSGVNTAAVYHNMVFSLEPDEALIIESEVPTSTYWSFCLCDRYTQLADFTYHQSSLNGHQARIGSDGKFRAVLSQKDPGVPNWLDPVDTAPLGLMQFRQFFQESAVGLPSVRKVKVEEVRRNLPSDTPSISPEERARQLKDRSWSVLSLYGY